MELAEPAAGFSEPSESAVGTELNTDPQVAEAIRHSISSSGFTFSLKHEQLACITAVLRGESVFAILPTGYGKSAIYQLLPNAWAFLDQLDGSEQRPVTVLVVSPLVALMKEQVIRARSMGMTSGKFPHSGEHDDREDAGDRGSGQSTLAARSLVTSGHYQLLFASPEALLDDGGNAECLAELGASSALRALVVDEAHCILEW